MWFCLSRWSYKPFGLNISELSDFSSEDEDTESRQQRIEKCVHSIIVIGAFIIIQPKM